MRTLHSWWGSGCLWGLLRFVFPSGDLVNLKAALESVPGECCLRFPRMKSLSVSTFLSLLCARLLHEPGLRKGPACLKWAVRIQICFGWLLSGAHGHAVSNLQHREDRSDLGLIALMSKNIQTCNFKCQVIFICQSGGVWLFCSRLWTL